MKLIDFENNVPEKVKEWETIGEFFGVDVTEDDVWKIARQSVEIPQFHNIYMGELVHKIIYECEIKYELNDGLFTYYINSLDSHLYVNSDQIFTRDDFFGYLLKHLLSNVCIDNGKIVNDFKLDKTTFHVGTPIVDVWKYINYHFDITIGNYIG